MLLILICTGSLLAQSLLVYMDQDQSDHLRAYGVTYWVLQHDLKAEWLLNYRGGSFLLPDVPAIREYATMQGVSFEPIEADAVANIYQTLEQNNMQRIYLDKAPKIAIYVPPTSDPWDDAVTLAMEYASIPYDKLWDKEVLTGSLKKYDWLHIHHEDFTGQFGKFFSAYGASDWYQVDVAKNKEMAYSLGFKSVQIEKFAVAKMIQAYVADGGFLLGMCAACDSLDIALAAEGIDIVPQEIDGTPITPDAQNKLDFTKTFAFENFKIVQSAAIYQKSDIDIDPVKEGIYMSAPPFQLFEFSAKEDPVPCMLNQCHTQLINDFLGQTSAFHDYTIKKNVTILARTPGTQRVKYLHGEFGKGTFTFYAGHDPEDYRHMVGDPPTDLVLKKNSPGYRLILNNVLFPAARKEKRKT